MEQQNRLWQYLVFPHVTDDKTLLALRLTCSSFRDFLAPRTDCSLLDPRLSWAERAAGFSGLAAARRRIVSTMQAGKLREVASFTAPPSHTPLLVGGRVVLLGDAIPGKLMVETDENGHLFIRGLAFVNRGFWGRVRSKEGGPVILLDRFIVSQRADDSSVVGVVDCVSGKALPMPDVMGLAADERNRSVVVRGSGNRFLFGCATIQLCEIAADCKSVHFLRSFRLEGEWGLGVALVHRGKTLLFKRSGTVTLSDALGGPEVEVGHIQYGGDNLLVDERVEDYVAFTGPLSNDMTDDEEDSDEGGHVLCLSRRVVGPFFDGAETLHMWRNGSVMVHYDNRILNFSTGRIERRFGRDAVGDPTSGLVITTDKNEKRAVARHDGKVVGEVPASIRGESFSFGNLLVAIGNSRYVHYTFE